MLALLRNPELSNIINMEERANRGFENELFKQRNQ